MPMAQFIRRFKMGSNLIYNGNFSHGADSWFTTSGETVSASNGILTITKGDLYQDTRYLFPVANGRRYRLTFDLKVNTKDSHPWYIALRCYDNSRQHINISSVNRPISVQTTLASALANGNTTVTLTSGANWPTSRTYQRIGICNKLAWGYNRCTYSQPYASISGNTITLKTAWAGGSWPAGTKVAEFEDGGTYYYPLTIANANLPTDWTSYSCEFNGGNSMRYSCQYVQFGTLGYAMNYSLRNIRLECISDNQELDWENYNSDIKKTSIIEANHFNEVGAKIRYIKDTTAGSTVNTSNHWCEFKVINSVGENIAWGKDIKNESGTVYSNSHGTDGTVSSTYLDLSTGTRSAIIDLGYIEEIQKIHIWHYYPDGRTYYNNKTEVSVDGVNWWTVYSGQKPETPEGNEIIVTNKQAQLYHNGELKANQFYEI